MDKNFESLQQALRNLEKPSLSRDMREGMKSHIFKQIKEKRYIPSSLERLRIALGRLAQNLRPTPEMRVRIKEAILSRGRRRDFGWGSLLQWQKGIAASVIAVIVFVTVTMYVGKIPVTSAAQSTTFQKIMGTVEVIRGEEHIKAEKGMRLQENDIIVTGQDGIAVIQYVDDSITRLSPKTELKIHKLYQDAQKETKTEVEIELTQGRVWSQVVNEIHEEASFQITTNDVTAFTRRAASFDIQNEGENESVTVSVFDNTVEVSLQDEENEQKQLVMEGFAVEVDQNNTDLDMIALQTEEEDKLWIDSNTAEDKNYIEEITETEDSIVVDTENIAVLTVERGEEDTEEEPVVTAVTTTNKATSSPVDVSDVDDVLDVDEVEEDDDVIDGDLDVPFIMPVGQGEQESDQPSQRFLQ
jgi:hypothetical protein